MTIESPSAKPAPLLPETATVPRLDPWLFGTVLPFWAGVGVDGPRGGFVERLTRPGAPADDDYKRILVQARQVYVFSHAHVLGAGDYALAAARNGYRFMTRHGWDADHGGWCFSVHRDGAPLDRRREFYTQAFVLLALAWYHRASGSREPLRWIRRTMEFLDGALADRHHDGYFETAVAGEAVHEPIRRQNPHMHLFEALLALHEATGDAGWLEKALRIRDLLRDRFTSPRDGGLGEYFTPDWRPAPGDAGRVREPGHHFEWVWLLHRHGSLSGAPGTGKLALPLYRFAWEHGVDRAPGMIAAAFDEVDETGLAIKDTKRLWPQTEALKAHLAIYEMAGDPVHRERAVAQLAMMFDHYLSPGSPLWREHLTRDGGDAFSFIPASSLYHLFVAVAEARRVLDL